KEYAFHPGRTALLTIDGKKLGIIGQIHPSVCANYDIDDEVYVAMIDFNTMYENQNDERTYHSLPRFPSVTRDLAILCDIDLPVLSLKKAIISGAGPLLEKVELFDIFTGEQIEKGKKSVAYSLTLRSDSGTLNEKQSDKVITKIIAEVEKLGATLRS
ncbi:MAG: phenylalanine--tRNA ligase subunit beta, partial [Clostridia bacterium]|nr:phenylalanine--tRNA ligase subunit beta [Clostridia bacterium]